jgi:hypothetical protein
MDIVTLTAFENELEKIALDTNVLGRISAKAAKRGWSPAREMLSTRQLMKAEGNQLAKAAPGLGATHMPRSAPFRFDPEQAHRQGSLVKAKAPAPALKITPQPPRPLVMGGTEGGTNPGVFHESIRRAA